MRCLDHAYCAASKQTTETQHLYLAKRLNSWYQTTPAWCKLFPYHILKFDNMMSVGCLERGNITTQHLGYHVDTGPPAWCKLFPWRRLKLDYMMSLRWWERRHITVHHLGYHVDTGPPAWCKLFPWRRLKLDYMMTVSHITAQHQGYQLIGISFSTLCTPLRNWPLQEVYFKYTFLVLKVYFWQNWKFKTCLKCASGKLSFFQLYFFCT